MFYSSFGILSLVLYIIINLRILRRDGNREESVERINYRRFLLSVILYLITDIIWGLAYENHLLTFVFLDTTVYFLAMALSVWLWTICVVDYVNNGSGFDVILKNVGIIMIIGVALSLAVNFFMPVVFVLDSSGVYRTLHVRYIFLGTQIVLYALTAVYTFYVFFKSSGKERQHNLTIATSSTVMTVFIVLQTLDPFMPFYAIGCLLTSVLVHSFLMEENERDRNIALEKALEEAKQANEAKTVFLSNMSHEIRTPINTVLGMNEIIRRDCNDEKILSCADNIQKAGNSLLGIISDILDFSKIEAGKMELHYDDYNLPGIIGDVYNLLLFRADEKGLEFKFEIAPELPRVLNGDELRIKQVITNLLTNAIKYTEKGSVIFKVTLLENERDKAKIRFSVVDTGIGIKEEEKVGLFEAFERLDTKRTRTIAGTGLGLSISATLLHMMGSELCFESVYNKGSEFSFELIQKVVDATPVGESWHDAVSSVGGVEKGKTVSFTAPDCRILLVDDTILNLEVICGLLEPTHIRIDTAISGTACIEKFAVNDYDFVFLDYLMPYMNGIETLAKIKGQFPEKSADIPFVCLTANAVSGERERMIEAGFTDFMTKPAIVSEMMNMLLKYLPEDKVRIGEVTEEQQESDTDEIPKELYEIPWIDVEEGIQYCGTAEMLMRALTIFTGGIDGKANLLEECLSNQDIKLFTITVHALKSTSLTMGMAEFSAKAKELELAGKANDVAKIKEKFPGFIEEFRSFKPVLAAVVE